MIEVIGPEESPEYRAACELRSLISDSWPSVVQQDNLEDQIRIVASAKCYGQKVVDIDLVVFITLATRRLVSKDTEISTSPDQKLPIYIKSLCLTIELKEKEQDGIRFDGNQVQVQYGMHWHSVTEQAHQQQVSLRKFFEAQKHKPPFVTAMIWLPNVPAGSLPDASHNVIGSHATWDHILLRIVSLNRPRRCQEGDAEALEIDAFRFCDPGDASAVIGLLTKRMETSALDRKKIEMLSKRKILANNAEYIEKLGTQLLVFRGRGGTGKTVHLLRFAIELYIERGARVLLLTYNKALVADLRRLLALMGITDVYGQQTIQTQTVHGYLYHLRKYLDQHQIAPSNFINQFESHRKFVLEKLRRLKIRGEDAGEYLGRKAFHLFSWDHVLIDEAQDWPDEEKQILFLIYDYKRFIVADGLDQFVRREARTDWRASVDVRNNSQIVQLRKSLRLKSGLCTFALALANRLDLNDWRLEKDENVHGGRIMVIEGDYAKDRRLHDDLVAQTVAAGNEHIDILFCVPPSLVRHNGKQTESIAGLRFRKWGYDVWDAVEYETRGTYPTSIKQLRIVQYDSCRGLEGWTCVNLRFDELYDYKVRQYQSPNQMTFLEDERAAHYFAALWLMIPMTRAIDTLVLQISSADHPVGRALHAAARDCPELVEWHKTAAG